MTEKDTIKSANKPSEKRVYGVLLQSLLIRIALPGVLTVALLLASIFGFFIPLLEDSRLEGRKETARELANSVHSLLQSYADLVPEQSTLPEAQAAAIFHIRQLRYGPQGKDYFWINDMHPTMIMHPYRTELEGTDLSDFKDPAGKHLFVEFVKVVEDQGYGYVDYQWWWQDTERMKEKISFVQRFEPWDWVVGTGLYVEDVKAEISLLKNRMVGASCALVIFVGLLLLFMTRQRYMAEKNQTLAENTLRQSEQKFRGVFNNANHFAWILGADYKLLEVNETALAAIEKNREAVVENVFAETPWWQGSEKSIPQLKVMLDQCLTGIEATGEFEHHFPNKTPQTVVFSAIPIFSKSKKVDRILVEGWDVTKQRSLEERLRQSQKMEAIGQLAGGIAHDFNNLLSGIMGNVNLLQETGGLTGENRDCLDQILIASERSADLTRQLLSFSRKGKLQNSAINLHDIIGEVVALLSRSIDRRIKISQKLEANNPIVEGDPTMLQNAFLNLGVNARDAMSQRPAESALDDELVFSSSEIFLDKESIARREDELEPGWYVQICVSDTGCGMTPRVLERIFEPFFTTKEKGKGTGLGLASSYGCMQAHKGSITVESAPNSGTIFTVLLPRSSAVIKKVPEEKLQLSLTGGRILFVDDDEILRQTMTRVLGHLGYETVTCSDGVEAVDYYSKNYKSIDLIILDLVMARMGGEVAFLHLVNINPEAKILISSGFAQNNAVDELIKLGACGFLGKPFQVSELSQIIANHITV